MPGVQEFIALGIVALVAGNLVWRRRARRAARAKTGDCGDCASAGPPPEEATVHFYRREETPEGPAGGAPGKST